MGGIHDQPLTASESDPTTKQSQRKQDQTQKYQQGNQKGAGWLPRCHTFRRSQSKQRCRSLNIESVIASSTEVSGRIEKEGSQNNQEEKLKG